MTIHFVGFRDRSDRGAIKDRRLAAAVRVFGPPDFFHRHWDRRAVDEVMPGDRVVFAAGDDTQAVRCHAYDDSAHQ